MRRSFVFLREIERSVLAGFHPGASLGSSDWTRLATHRRDMSRERTAFFSRASGLTKWVNGMTATKDVPAEVTAKVPAKAAPLPSIFIVMTEAVNGQEDEFNDWYTNIHCHDTMRFKGSVATQRWKLSPWQLRYNEHLVGPEQRWLCIYEMMDTQANIDAHVEDCFTDRLPITSAQRIDKAEDFYYVPAAGTKNAVDAYNSRNGHLLLVRMNVVRGKDDEFVRWFREKYMPRVLKLIGFVDGELFRAADIQLIDAVPRYQYSAVFHIADPMVAVESLDSHLAQAGTLVDCPLVEPGSIGIACYSAITNRFTAEQALNLPPVQRELEDRFRANMGDRRHFAEAPDGLKIKRSS